MHPLVYVHVDSDTEVRNIDGKWTCGTHERGTFWVSQTARLEPDVCWGAGHHGTVRHGGQEPADVGHRRVGPRRATRGGGTPEDTGRLLTPRYANTACFPCVRAGLVFCSPLVDGKILRLKLQTLGKKIVSTWKFVPAAQNSAVNHFSAARAHALLDRWNEMRRHP